VTATAELAHLARALKTPRIRRVAGPLAERARAEGWDYQRYLAAVLEEEVLARETSGGQLRVKAARLPAVKTLDDFDFSFQRSVRKQVIAHLAQLDFLLEAHNVVFLGPPAPARRICRSPWPSRRPGAATESRLPPPISGSTGWTPQPGPGGSTLNWSGCVASRYWSATRSATSPSPPRRPRCSSRWSPRATSTPA
jgi:hypothetical protein